MREFFRRLLSEINKIWQKWARSQKLVFGGIVVVIIIVAIIFFRVSGGPQAVPLLSRTISDSKELDAIAARLDEEQVEYTITSDQRILVDSQQTARKLRAILTSEDLIPGDTDPWDLFDIERWTQTDFERNINLRRALTRQLEQHIAALDDVDSASVTLVIPEVELFAEDQNPVTASIVLSIKPGSNIRESKQKIEGIEKLVQFAIEGLQSEYITIVDRNGIILNDFTADDSLDRIELTRRELRLKRELELRYINSITNALVNIYGKDRVEIINIDVVIDTAKKTQETQEYFPIETVPDNPDTPFSERQFVLAIPRSTQSISESYEGTGFNPQGPAGQEGQTPPAYQDLEGLVGRYNNDENRINNEVSGRTTVEEKSPEISRITAAVALDGIWRLRYDERGQLIRLTDGSISREYIPVDAQSLRDAQELVQAAIGFNLDRGDSVSVRHVQFDRSIEHAAEDARARRRELLVTSISYAAIGFGVILILFFIIRAIRVAARRRLEKKNAELAKKLGRPTVEQSEEESVVNEFVASESDLLKQVSNIARDHPEEVAQLMRSWIVG